MCAVDFPPGHRYHLDVPHYFTLPKLPSQSLTLITLENGPAVENPSNS